jgi:hypothetical protein
MSMVDMWQTIQNQETTPHWELLAGWRKSYELTLQHMSAVKSYRDNLAAAWPPETSKASEAYISRLNQLIDHLQQTYDAAVANHSAFSGATLALSSARRELEPVVSEYLVNSAKIADYERELASPPPVGEDGIAPPVQNPIAAGRQAELEAKARSIMSGLSSELTSARTQIRKPEPYNAREIGGSTEEGGPDDYVPPPIPPVTPIDPGVSPGASDRSPGSASAGHLSSLGSPGGVAASPNGTGRLPGLVLGGTQPPLVAPPGPSPINPSLVGGPQPPTGPLAPIASGTVGLPPGKNGRPGLGRPGSAMPGKPAVSGPRPTPPPGIIGARPTTLPGQTSGRPPSTVNPVGGVINPSSPGKAGGGTAPRATTTPLGAVGNRPHEDADEMGTAQRWDPDNPWATAKGVAPVLQPQEERPVDPGPAIGLS